MIKNRDSNGRIASFYPDEENKRYCVSCKNLKNKLDFYKDKRGKDGLTRKCKPCWSKSSYSSRKKRPKHKSERYEIHRKRLLKNYGLCEEDYNSMLESQAGTCKICHSPPKSWSDKKYHKPYLYIDHDHETGEVRGLLCHKCNSGLGYFNDSLELLEGAVKYLRKE